MGKQPWITHEIGGRERSKHRSRDSCQVNGTALAAGMAANLLDHEPEASALPLTSRSNDAKTLSSARHFRGAWACAVFWLWTVPAVSDDWPSFRGPQHNGVSAEAGWSAQWPDSGPKIAWRQDVGIGVASFAVVGQRVITMGNRADQDLVWCFDADSGRVLWQFPYPCKFEERCFEGGTASTPTVDGSFVYTLAYDGQVHCLRLEDGRVVWQKHLVNDFGGRLSSYKYAGSPLVTGNVVIFDAGAEGNSTVALDKTSGQEVWGNGEDLAGYATPIPFEHAGQRGVLIFKARALVAHDLVGGRELWRIEWKTYYDCNASTPRAGMSVHSAYSSLVHVLVRV